MINGVKTLLSLLTIFPLRANGYTIASIYSETKTSRLRSYSTTTTIDVPNSTGSEKDVEGNKILWEPTTDYMKETMMYRFQHDMGITGGYEELWQWSNSNSDEFWTKLMDYVNVTYSGSTSPVKIGNMMPDVTYFPNVQINFAENMLRHGTLDSPLRGSEAVVSISESRSDRRWTFADLRTDASRISNALRRLGVSSLDSCGAYQILVKQLLPCLA
jgi:Acetyl-coenzyme A synthetase N-terminus